MKNRAIKYLFGLTTIFWTLSLSGLVSFGLTVTKSELAHIENRAGELSRNWDARSAKEAVELFKSASEYYLANREFEENAPTLIEIYKLNLMLNNLTEAEKTLLLLVKNQKKSKNMSGESEASAYLALLYLRKNELGKAAAFSQKAVELAEKSNNYKSLGLANLALGEIHGRNRKIDEMIAVQEKSLEYFRQSENKPFEAEILTSMSYAFSMNNNSERAISCADSAVGIQRNLNAKRGLAFALVARGDANQRIGNWRIAFESLKEAETLFSADLDLGEKAVLFTKLGVHYETFGDWKNAFDYFKKSHELYFEAGDLIGYSELSIVLGQIAYQSGDYDDAINYFNKGKTESEKLNDSWSLAMAHERLGQVYDKMNLPKQAVYHLETALKLVEQEKNVNYRKASIQSNLGKVYQNMRDYKSALHFFELAKETNLRVNNILAQSDNFYYIALIESARNDLEKAKKNIEASLLLTDKITSQTANSKLQRTFFSNVFDRYELYINILMKLNRQNPNESYRIEALQAVEKSRARSILENLSLSEAAFTIDADVETIKRENEIRALLNIKADKLTDLLSQNAEKNETDKISNEINELENELEEIKANLKQNSPVYSAIKNPAPFDVGEFQKNILDDDSLLLEFSFGDEESYLWLIGKNEFNSYILPPREQIESKIQILRELLASREMLKDESIEDYQTRIAKAETDYLIIAKDLSRELFGQVAGKFGNKRLIVVPDGKLGYFPVSALPLPNSENNEPILLSNEVVYQPSASTLSILAKNTQRKNSASKSLLIFSDPVFSADDSRLSPENKNDLSANNETGEKFRFVESLNSLARLDFSKTEADSIVDILGKSNADNFSGFAANREKLLNINTTDYKILHFATHGLIDESRPELSGIVLSRFDENGNKSDEFFRLHDIYGMNLNSDLVVLSACNTGIGKEVRGEGLMSLNNAFLSVGAKSVMSSLWKVEDGATLELMKNFYDAMANENLTPSKALQQAQIKMRRNSRYQSPFYWAAFTVQGDFRNVPEISPNYGYWIYSLPLAAVFFLGIFGIKGFIQRRNRK